MLTTLTVDGGQVGASNTTLIEGELDAVVDTVCAKYPQCRRAEAADVVLQSYRCLAERATVRAHLIPLTLNRSLRMMRASAQGVGPSPDEDALKWAAERPTG